jgi:hypothetical protein
MSQQGNNSTDRLQGIPALGLDGTTLRILKVDSQGKLVLSGTITGGGGTEFAEDDPHTTGDLGTQVLAVRSDAGGSLVDTDGDYAPLQVDANGALRVTGGGGGTEYAEDAASASDPVGNMLIARRRDTPAGETTTDGDNVALNATDKGELYVKHRDAIPVTDNGGSITVDGAVTVSGTADVTGSDVTATISDGGGSITVDDGGASITVDGTVGISGTVPVSDGGSTLSIDDGGASITVDGSVSISGTPTVNTELVSITVDDAMVVASAPVVVSALGGYVAADSSFERVRAYDADTGAGSDPVLGVVLRKSASGGSVELGTSTNPIRTDPTGTTAQPVTDNGGSLTVDGTVTVQDGGGAISIDDNGGSITVDGTVTVSDGGGSVTVDGTVAATQSGTWNVRAQDGSGNALASTTGNPQAADRGLVVKEPGFSTFEADHRTLTASTDTTITFSATVSAIRIVNWDTANAVLVKDGAISSDTDAAAARVGRASGTGIPSSRVFPIESGSIHVRSAGASEITIEGYR